MLAVDWITWGIPTGIGALSVLLTFVQVVISVTKSDTTLHIETSTKQQRSRINLTLKPNDVQELEQADVILRGIWYRVSNEMRGAVPRFSGPWREVSGDLRFRRGDVVWFRCVVVNVDFGRVLRDLPLSFYEFPVLKWISTSLKVVRRRSPVGAMPAAGESVQRVLSFSVEEKNGPSYPGGAARLKHLNPFDQAFLEVVFRVAPSVLQSWTFRSPGRDVLAEVLKQQPRPLAVVLSAESPPRFQGGPPE